MALPVAVLQALPLLRNLPAEQYLELGLLAQERSFGRREVVYRKGEAGEALCFLVEGRLQAVDFTLDGREVGLYFVEAGDYFGELAVIDGGARPDFMIAVGRSRVVFMPRAVARKLFFNVPGVADQVMTRLAGRLRGLAAQRIMLSLPNPAQRVCAQLWQMIAAAPAGATEIAHAPTHQEIAIMVNTSRETVTRVFQVLQTRNIVQRDGARLRILDAAFLQGVAEGSREAPRLS